MSKGKAVAVAVAAAVAAEHANWKDDQHVIFVKLCVAEVAKGNRPTTTLTKEAWKSVFKEFRKQTNKNYTLKQLKNHWDAMKGDYKVFKKLKFGQSGLGWNEMTKTIEAPEEWWNERLAENSKFSKFKGKDLSLFVNYYDTLFGDVIASGDREKTANTYSAVHLDVGEEVPDFGDDDDGTEGSGDSDDNKVQSPPAQNLFQSTSFKSGTSSGSKRKRSGAEYVREGLDGLVAAMSCRSTSTTAATEDASLTEAITLIDSMTELEPGSDLYFFAGRYILHPGNRQLFLKAPSNALRYGQLMYNFKHFKGPGN